MRYQWNVSQRKGKLGATYVHLFRTDWYDSPEVNRITTALTTAFPESAGYRVDLACQETQCISAPVRSLNDITTQNFHGHPLPTGEALKREGGFIK